MEPLVIGLMIFATVFVGTLALTRRAPERELVAVRLRQIAQDRSPRNLVLTLPFYRRALVPLVTAAVRVVTRVTPPRRLGAPEVAPRRPAGRRRVRRGDHAKSTRPGAVLRCRRPRRSGIPLAC